MVKPRGWFVRRRLPVANDLSALLDALPGYVGLLAPDGSIRQASRAALGLVGLDAVAVRGYHLAELGWWVPQPQAGEWVHAAVARAAQGEGSRISVEIRLANGRVVPVSLGVEPLRDAEGTVSGLLALGSDAGERRRAVARLRERTLCLRDIERRFERLVQGVTDYAIFMLDREGRVSSWNSGAARIKGYAAEQILGRSFECFFTEEDRAAGVPARALAEAAHTGRYESEGWRVRGDGTRFWASAVLDAIVGDGDELLGFAKITRDITERREMERRLAQAQKMEAIGQLTGGIAHDFNNLLQAVSSNLELARAAATQGSTARTERLIGNALRAIDRGGRLTGQLLAFSRRQILHAERVLLPDLVADMADLLHGAASDSVVVETRAAPELWSCRIDPAQFESALLNLVLNARDAMPRGGLVSISMANAQFAAAEAGALELPAGDYVRIEVADTGAGMSPEILARASEPFFTTKEVGKGSGLGLPQVIGFTRQSGGAVRLESLPGRGTTATLLFPRDADPEPAPPAGPPLAEQAGLDVLVVEQDPRQAEALRAALAKAGHRVRVVSGAATALAAVESEQALDLLLCDLVPAGGIGALQVIRAARRRRPSLPVMLACGELVEALEGAGLRPPADILGRPVLPADVMRRIALLVPGYGVV
jgi:PAS domain S-box-containing protein